MQLFIDGIGKCTDGTLSGPDSLAFTGPDSHGFASDSHRFEPVSSPEYFPLITRVYPMSTLHYTRVYPDR